MGTVGTILIAIFVFGFLIFIHEFGHYIFARIFKVTITEFSIGMGPKLVWYDSKKTGIRYALSSIPFGGYVAMEGENGGMPEAEKPKVNLDSDIKEDSRNILELNEANDHVAIQNDEGVKEDVDQARKTELVSVVKEETEPFDKKPAYQRLIITVAGALVNIVAGFVALIIFTSFVRIGGTTIYDFPETDYEISSEDSGLRAGDTIIRVDGKRVRISDELSYEIMRRGTKPIDVTVIRDGKEKVIPNVIFPAEEASGQMFGMIDFRILEVEKNPWRVIEHSFAKSILIIRMCWESIFDLITGRYTLAAVSGPVGISGAIGDAASSGILPLLYIVAVISINLGVMNLLPIPALDGGRTITTLAEMVTGKRIPAKIENTVNAIFLAILLGFSVLIMVKDVIQLFV